MRIREATTTQLTSTEPQIPPFYPGLILPIGLGHRPRFRIHSFNTLLILQQAAHSDLNNLARHNVVFVL
jgi:hypothetical protein